jgi:hypothetical protein
LSAIHRDSCRIKILEKQKFADASHRRSGYNDIRGSCTGPPPNISGGTAADWQAPLMQKFVDKWFLPFLFVIIGSIIAWSLWQR